MARLYKLRTSILSLLANNPEGVHWQAIAHHIQHELKLNSTEHNVKIALFEMKKQGFVIPLDEAICSKCYCSINPWGLGEIGNEEIKRLVIRGN